MSSLFFIANHRVTFLAEAQEMIDEDEPLNP
jgi:hypothetical protein